MTTKHVQSLLQTERMESRFTSLVKQHVFDNSHVVLDNVITSVSYHPFEVMADSFGGPPDEQNQEYIKHIVQEIQKRNPSFSSTSVIEAQLEDAVQIFKQLKQNYMNILSRIQTVKRLIEDERKKHIIYKNEIQKDL